MIRPLPLHTESFPFFIHFLPFLIFPFSSPLLTLLFFSIFLIFFIIVRLSLFYFSPFSLFTTSSLCQFSSFFPFSTQFCSNAHSPSLSFFVLCEQTSTVHFTAVHPILTIVFLIPQLSHLLFFPTCFLFSYPFQTTFVQSCLNFTPPLDQICSSETSIFSHLCHFVPFLFSHFLSLRLTPLSQISVSHITSKFFLCWTMNRLIRTIVFPRLFISEANLIN